MSPELQHYLFRISPAAMAFSIFIFFIPQSLKPLRIFGFILLFILFRDAMTPAGLWTITETLEIRFIQQPSTLLFLSVFSLAFVLTSHFFIESINKRTLWLKKTLLKSLALGVFSGLLIAALPLLFRSFSSMPSSPKPEGLNLVVSIFIFSLIGNLLEETIFRGYFQTWLEELNLSRARRIILSGGLFAVCHSYLAFTVTSIGWPILVFTFYEGLICAFLKERFGLLAAVLAHGTGIFIISYGLV